MYISHKKLRNIINSEEDTPEKAMQISHLVNEYYDAHIPILKQFVAIAYRWGDKECHSYPIGLYGTIEEAIAQGLEHNQYRGGKYDIVVYMCNQSGEMTEVCDCGMIDAVTYKIRQEESV